VSKYEHLDSQILSTITHEPKPFRELFTGNIEKECVAIAATDPNPEPFRILDRRLQHHRRAGVIKSTRQGWVEAEAPK